MKVLKSLVLLCVLAGMGSGCATNRGIVDICVPVSSNLVASATKPIQTVVITRVTDHRVFEKAPAIPSIPSLKGGEIEDPAITSRAIARKRNTYGKALGDILLPEGRTVADVVRESLTKAFRDAGYCVVEGTADASGEAIPVEADFVLEVQRRLQP